MARENEDKRGAKTKLTPAVQKSICEMIAAVATLQEAAYANGLDPSTVYDWLNKGKDQPGSIYANFSKAIEVARHQRTMGLKAQIRGHGKKDWRALAALGAITDPAEFVPKIRIHITNEFDAAIERLMVEFADAPETLERALHAIAGGARHDQARQSEVGSGGGNNEGGEAVRPSSAEPEAEGVPRT